jgi:arginine/lysine/ornithine decarboxylase
LLDEHHDIACVVITSPTYAGVISDVSAIAAVCDAKHVPLIVDEAHGAHTAPELSALARGADLVVHSVHKTLGALTQVGLVHVSHRSLVPPHAVRACLTLLQTSSPSYLLLSSLEAALADVAGAGLSERLSMLRARCLQDLSGIDGVHVLGEEGGQRFAQDAAHLLVRMDGVEPEKLFDRCCQRGVFPESVLGTGALFLLGTGTAPADVMTLAQALASIAGTIERLGGSLPSTYALSRQKQQAQQVLSPRQAYLSQCEIVPLHEAIGRIAAECVAPCPPGTPVIVPGMRVMEEDVYSSRLTHLRVVVESGSRRS